MAMFRNMSDMSWLSHIIYFWWYYCEFSIRCRICTVDSSSDTTIEYKCSLLWYYFWFMTLEISLFARNAKRYFYGSWYMAWYRCFHFTLYKITVETIEVIKCISILSEKNLWRIYVYELEYFGYNYWLDIGWFHDSTFIVC